MHRIMDELFCIAEKSMQNSALQKNQYEQVNVNRIGLSVSPLVHRYHPMFGLSDQELVEKVFTAEAIAELCTLPNMFWCWRIVRDAVIFEDDESRQMGLSSIRKAMRQNSALMERSVDLSKMLADLTAEEVGLWVACGIFVVKVQDRRPQLIRNPVFPRKFGKDQESARLLHNILHAGKKPD